MIYSLLAFDDASTLLATIPEGEASAEDLANGRMTRATIAALRGDRTAWPEGLAASRALVAGQSNMQLEWSWAVSATWVAIAEGRWEDARRESASIGGNWAAWGAIARGRVALHDRDAAGVRAALASADLQLELGRIFDVERSGLGAGLAALEGRPGEAAGRFQEAARMARDLGAQGELGALLLDAIGVLGPDDPVVPAFAAEARALYERAGARAYLDRLEVALRRTPGAPRVATGAETGVSRTV
jgi:hypothetical protein